MTFKGTVSVQKWVVMLLLPIIITILGVGGNIIIGGTNIKDRVEINEKHIEEHEVKIDALKDNKVNKVDNEIAIQRVYDILDRIENKVDNLNKN